MHPPLLSLPSRSESSLVPSASRILQLTLYNLGCAFVLLTGSRPRKLFVSHLAVSDDCAPSKSFRALRRSLRCSDSANSTCVSLTSARLTTPGSAASSGFPSPSTLLSASASPTLFRVGVARGLPFFLRRFLPVRSPGSLSARGVLRVVGAFVDLAVVVVARLRGCQHRTDALPPRRGFSASRCSLLPWWFSPSRS
jgi:hypothetical protein